jgi:hypothetical protein
MIACQFMAGSTAKRKGRAHGPAFSTRRNRTLLHEEPQQDDDRDRNAYKPQDDGTHFLSPRLER